MTDIWTFKGDHEFLSNFHRSPVTLADGITYPTAEHAYQACKTTSLSLRQMIAGAATPGQAKKMGRQVPLRADWNEVKLAFMREVISRKFAAGTDLARRLDETGHVRLFEGNHWGDTYWGVNDRTGAGENHLGLILEERRRLNREE